MSSAHFETITHTRFLKFTLGGAPFLLPLLSVRDVIETPERSSAAAPSLLFQGTALHEGATLPVLDLRLKLGRRPAAEGSSLVVCSFSDGYSLALRVDKVVSILLLDARQRAPSGVTLLDPEQLLSSREKKAAAAAARSNGKAA